MFLKSGLIWLFTKSFNSAMDRRQVLSTHPSIHHNTQNFPSENPLLRHKLNFLFLFVCLTTLCKMNFNLSNINNQHSGLCLLIVWLINRWWIGGRFDLCFWLCSRCTACWLFQSGLMLSFWGEPRVCVKVIIGVNTGWLFTSDRWGREWERLH